jgi:hypothetical protein
MSRLTEICEAEFEREVERLVERSRPGFEREIAAVFEAARTQPCVLCEIPIVGAVQGFVYSPHASQHRDLEKLIVQAMCARKWFEFEAPPWAQPLPLSEEDCVACFNCGGDRRAALVGHYARTLRGMHWAYKLAPPFELHCAYSLVAPPDRAVHKRRGSRIRF